MSSSFTFSLCPQSFPASESFPLSYIFASGGQSIGASTSASVLPMNIQDWLPLGWTGLISLLSKELSRVFYSSTVRKHQFFGIQPSLWSNWHPHMITGKTIALTIWIFVGEVMSLLYNILSRFVIVFLPRSKSLFISWLQSPSTVIFEPKKIRLTLFPLFLLSICHEVMGPDAMIFVLWMLSIKPTFSLCSFTFIKRLFSSSSLSAIKGGVICISKVIDISPSNLDPRLCFIQPTISHDVVCI